MSGITTERRRDVLKQLHAELVKIMGNIEGLDRAVAQFEKQAYDQSEGNNDMYIRRIAMRLQRTKEKVQAAKAQPVQHTQQSQQAQNAQNAQYLRHTPSPSPMPQQQPPQQYQHLQQQQQYRQGQYPQQQQQQPLYHQQAQYMQPQQAPMPAAPTPGTYTQGQQSRQGAHQPSAAYQSQSNQSSNSMHHAMSAQQSMGPDAAIFAEMAQDLLLGPSQTQPADPPAQPVQPAQLSQQNTQSMPQGYLVPDQSQSWQRPASTAPQPQHQQQVPTQAAQGRSSMPAAPAHMGMHTYWPGQQPNISQPYSQQPQPQQQQQVSHQQSAAHDPALTEKYWQLLELMRQEFLADIAEYYNCMAPSIQGEMQPAYASKLAKMKSVIQRLSISRDMPHYNKRQWSLPDLEALQSLGKQLRMYCAKIRAALAPIRRAKMKELELAAQRAGQVGQVPVKSEGFPQAVQAGSQALPSEAALVRQPSVAAAVHQALPDMPAPPVTMPLSDTSSGSHGLPEGVLEDKAATDVKQEVVLALEAAGPPAHSLLSRLAGATPGALGCSAAAAEKVLKRKADLISSPSLPHHLQPVLQGRSSLSEAFTRVESTNIYQDGQDVSPDRVFDHEAASRAPPSAKEAKLLDKLREKLEKETQEGLQGQKGSTIICESKIPGTLIVRFTPASNEGSPSAGGLRSLGFSGQLSLRVSTDYPESTPAYFRQITSDQTVQEQTQASAVQERFQAAVMDFQELLTVTSIIQLWVQALQ